MPGAPRPKGKAKKIAYDLLGKPQNMQKENQKQKALDRRLVFEETFKVK